MKRVLRTVLETILGATTRKEVRAVCYTCKDRVKPGDHLYYAAPPEKDFWCQACGTKIRVVSGSHQCIFFQGLVSGEID